MKAKQKGVEAYWRIRDMRKNTPSAPELANAYDNIESVAGAVLLGSMAVTGLDMDGVQFTSDMRVRGELDGVWFEYDHETLDLVGSPKKTAKAAKFFREVCEAFGIPVNEYKGGVA